MPGIKRKSAEEESTKINGSKKPKSTSENASKADKKFANKLATREKKPKVKEGKAEKQKKKVEESDEEDTEEGGVALDGYEEDEVKPVKTAKGDAGKLPKTDSALNGSTDGANVTKSRESHIKQKELVRERKAAKPNADAIQRAKKLWERLRVKSKVEKEERAKLVAELFDIVSGNVKEFVFKHDSVRPIQSALKYGSPEQKRMIAQELKGSYKELLEGKYSRHLVGKLLEKGDDEIRDLIIPEFYGSIRRLINQPEASWMLDDIYRVKATKAQRDIMLREWYGAEFALEKGRSTNLAADLTAILKESPEKRKPILEYLHQLINQLIQKKLTGFTMLHDALLQYFLQLEVGSSDFNDCMRLIIGDKKEEEEDLLKNLAFTPSGSELASLVLAYGSAKDRKLILRAYKDAFELVARDQHGWKVLVTAYEVIDDTRETLQRIFTELTSHGTTEEKKSQQEEKILGLSTQLHGRIGLLFPFVGPEKWLLGKPEQQGFVKKIRKIRETTSKKEAETRRKELVAPLSEAYIATVAANASVLVKDSYGCQFISAVLLSAVGDKAAAVEAVTAQMAGEPGAEGHPATMAHAGRLLRSLIAGGHFDPKQRKVVLTAPDLGLADALYENIADHVIDWATGASSFVVVALMEAEDFSRKNELEKKLKENKKMLEKASKDVADTKGNAGSRLLLEKLKA